MDTMAAMKKKKPTSFQQLFTELFLEDWRSYKKEIRGSMSSLHKKVDATAKITEEVREQTTLTNGRVTKLERHVYGKLRWRKIFTDRNLAYIVAFSILILLIIIATILDVDIPKL